MPFKIDSVHLGGAVKVIAPTVFPDHRGFFLEVFRRDLFESLGLPTEYGQWNHSGSVKGVVRGLHFQYDPPMGKLMRVTRGSAYVMAVDIRKGSPTLGQWFGIEASEENRLMVYAPASFARGFCALSDFAEVQYLCTSIYNPRTETAIRWNDPAMGINWPVSNPIMTDKDANAQTLAEWLARPESDHFVYTA